MKKVINEYSDDIVELEDIDYDTPIFACKDDKLVGMLVQEENGWILKIGGNKGSSGWYDSREECIKQEEGYGVTFMVE